MNLTTFLKSIISEDNGNPSTMRIVVIGIVATVLFNWTYYNMTHGVVTNFDPNDLVALLGPLLLKGWQKGKEAKTPPETTEPEEGK